LHIQAIISSKIQQKSSGNVVFMHIDAISYSVALTFFMYSFILSVWYVLPVGLNVVLQLDRRDVWVEHSEVLKRL